jgi:hypothetical protein
MKNNFLVCFLITLFVSLAAFAQDKPLEEDLSPLEELEIQAYMRDAEFEAQQKEMQLQQQKIAFQTRQQRQQIELEKQKLELQHHRRALAEHNGHKEHLDEGGGIILVIIIIVNILLAVWVYTDIRKLNAGSGIWIVVVLLTGLLGVIPYAIVRLGNIQKS